jgi:two-component system, OmpR family, sensor histidine kinase KdpD
VATVVAAPASTALDGDVRHEARLVGLRGFSTPTLEDVERRRLQLWLVTVVILVGACAAIGLASADHPHILRVGVAALAVAFTGYTVEKELHLRRLTRMLVEERVLSAGLNNRLQELTALLEAGKAINSVLDLASVLEIILGSASQLLEARGGSIMLLEGGERLRALCVRGNDAAAGAVARLDEGIAGRVAASGEPVVVNGHIGGRIQPVESAMCVPLSHRGELLGVLNVNAGVGRSYTEYDLRALGLFAEQAASAIANARLYETERRHVAELMELERQKSEFLAAVSHDLRTPLTTMVGCTKTLQRRNLPEEHRMELAAMVDRQGERLRTMIEDLLAAARLEAEAPPARETVELRAILDEVVAESAISDRPVSLEAPAAVDVLGTPESLRRIVCNLVDNAFKYGAPPVLITVESRPDGKVLLSVLDHGEGIPAADRERVFERFCRLDVSRHTTGIGLGLPIVQGLVASCGGSVWADEHRGGGAAIRVLLDQA